MGLKRILGLEKPISGSEIGVALTNVTIPLDLALSLVFRQQDQIFSTLNEMQAKIDVAQAIMGAVTETTAGLAEDVRLLKDPDGTKQRMH